MIVGLIAVSCLGVFSIPTLIKHTWFYYVFQHYIPCKKAKLVCQKTTTISINACSARAIAHHLFQHQFVPSEMGNILRMANNGAQLTSPHPLLHSSKRTAQAHEQLHYPCMPMDSHLEYTLHTHKHTQTNYSYTLDLMTLVLLCYGMCVCVFEDELVRHIV